MGQGPSQILHGVHHGGGGGDDGVGALDGAALHEGNLTSSQTTRRIKG